jgi:hypothetical protein
LGWLRGVIQNIGGKVLLVGIEKEQNSVGSFEVTNALEDSNWERTDYIFWLRTTDFSFGIETILVQGLILWNGIEF